MASRTSPSQPSGDPTRFGSIPPGSPGSGRQLQQKVSGAERVSDDGILTLSFANAHYNTRLCPSFRVALANSTILQFIPFQTKTPDPDELDKSACAAYVPSMVGERSAVWILAAATNSRSNALGCVRWCMHMHIRDPIRVQHHSRALRFFVFSVSQPYFSRFFNVFPVAFRIISGAFRQDMDMENGRVILGPASGFRANIRCFRDRRGSRVLLMGVGAVMMNALLR
ncbi:transporter, SSS family [Anopheles sinensis]|uniref:Transporter, SSS family n=1 Tax=Anopheles sinensis TaxID=74873 RepID=A0A084VTF4_ANOSI|nr:transporter, SSS family [Anopheles sinensis]